MINNRTTTTTSTADRPARSARLLGHPRTQPHPNNPNQKDSVKPGPAHPSLLLCATDEN
jgi:hypothetical protein